MYALVEYLPSWPVLCLGCVIVFGASIVQGALGMGYGLAAAPLLALLDPIFVPATTVMIGFLSSTLGAWSERDEIVWNEVRVGVLGRILGSALAVAVLYLISDKSMFSLVFGVAVGIAVVFSTAGWKLPFTRTTLVCMGFLSGLMGTITGVGAPPFALIYQSREPLVARPTLAAIFSLGCLVSLVFLMLIGWVQLHHWLLCLILVPAMYLGLATARKHIKALDHRYKTALLMVAGAASGLLILRGLTGV